MRPWKSYSVTWVALSILRLFLEIARHGFTQCIWEVVFTRVVFIVEDENTGQSLTKVFFDMESYVSLRSGSISYPYGSYFTSQLHNVRSEQLSEMIGWPSAINTGNWAFGVHFFFHDLSMQSIKKCASLSHNLLFSFFLLLTMACSSAV